jgi:hypothetical protein
MMVKEVKEVKGSQKGHKSHRVIEVKKKLQAVSFNEANQNLFFHIMLSTGLSF